MIRSLRCIRARLTAWYVVVTAMFLIVFGACTYALLLRALQQRMDSWLVVTATSFEHALRVELTARTTCVHFDGDHRARKTAELPFPDRPIAVFLRERRARPIALAAQDSRATACAQ
jgi:hypothetical protein